MKAELHLSFDNIGELKRCVDLLSPNSIPVKVIVEPEIIPVVKKDPEPVPSIAIPQIFHCALTECGKEFEKQSASQRHCSKRCYMKDYWKTYKSKKNKPPEKQTPAACMKELHFRQTLAKLKKETPAPQRERPNCDRQLG